VRPQRCLCSRAMIARMSQTHILSRLRLSSKARDCLRTALACAVTAAVVLTVASPRALEAQQRAGTLPSNCSAGELVVADSFGQFRCRPPGRALQLSGCNSGDFVSINSSGELSCTRPSSFSSGARNLLPSCSSGESLQSEGYGSWRCSRGVSLPSCSSGESIVADGSSWRCYRPASR
jgi:hypothetical protein